MVDTPSVAGGGCAYVPAVGQAAHRKLKQVKQTASPFNLHACRGTYNPLTHTWAVLPRDQRFHDQQAVTERATFTSGSHHKSVPLPANQGLYNPIQARLSGLRGGVPAWLTRAIAPGIGHTQLLHAVRCCCHR